MSQTNYLLKVVTETNQTFACFILLITSTWFAFSSKLHLRVQKKTSIFPCSYYPTLSYYGMTFNQWWAILILRYPWYYRSKLRCRQYLLVLGLIPIRVRTVPVDGPFRVQLRLFCTNQWTIEPNLAGFQQWEFCQHR